MTDSACSLPADLARDNGVTVVPMWVTIDGRQYRDSEVNMQQLTTGTADGVSTSGPAPGELARAVESADGGDGVLVLTVSRRMSAVYDAARLAAQLLAGRSVAVLDTGTAAGPKGWWSWPPPVPPAPGCPSRRSSPPARGPPTAPAWWPRCRPSTTWPGGAVCPGLPVGSALARAPSPVRVPGGQGEAIATGPGRDGACQRMIALWAAGLGRQARTGARLHVAALHAQDPAVAQDLLREVCARAEPATSFVGSFTPVMVAHTGPSLAGLAWWWEEPAGQGAAGTVRAGRAAANGRAGAGRSLRG